MKEVVCGVIEDSSGKVLVCRRGAGRHLAGLWEFPGGKVDEGETLEGALIRELEEELGISVDVGKRLNAVVEWADEKISIRLTGYWCRISHGAPVALEHEEVIWCHISDIAGLEWAEADLPLVEEISGARL